MSAQPIPTPPLMERPADSPDVNLDAGRKPAQPTWRIRGRQLWVRHTWWARKQYWKLLCAFNSHSWEKAVEPKNDGTATVDGNCPTRYERCKRPECRIYSAKRQLIRVKNFVETDDFIILAKLDCKQCYGRGYRGTMRLPGNCRAKIPCGCLTIQPEFMEHIKADLPSEKARRNAESKGVTVQ